VNFGVLHPWLLLELLLLWVRPVPLQRIITSSITQIPVFTLISSLLIKTTTPPSNALYTNVISIRIGPPSPRLDRISSPLATLSNGRLHRGLLSGLRQLSATAVPPSPSLARTRSALGISTGGGGGGLSLEHASTNHKHTHSPISSFYPLVRAFLGRMSRPYSSVLRHYSRVRERATQCAWAGLSYRPGNRQVFVLG
jgi:hypothetical protein